MHVTVTKSLNGKLLLSVMPQITSWRVLLKVLLAPLRHIQRLTVICSTLLLNFSRALKTSFCISTLWHQLHAAFPIPLRGILRNRGR
mmetsp:Transcript_6934/g.21877  ORF Transcript_6934/g.21877 Transcript_6934/m.21877 type:complete len:87 (+) Transcript_6934:1746-2006(+)